MCQPKSKGGRRCPAHMSATRNARVTAAKASGLTPNQVTTTFNELREEGRGRPAPTMRQYAAYIQRQLDFVANSSMDNNARVRARKLLVAATNENLPDGATFYALTKLSARARSQSRALRREISNLAPQLGMTRSDAMRQFWNVYHNSESAETALGSAPAGYSNDMGNISAAAHGLPRDAATGRAYAALRRSASTPETNPNIETTRRVERRPVESSFISEIGYDPEDGRLEVVFSRTPDQVYAYRNVSASTWEQMNQPGASVGSIYSRQVRRNPDHAYNSHEEAEADAYRRRCGYCGQFRAASHVCPESQGEISEPRVAEPVISVPPLAPEPEITVSEDTHLPQHSEPVSIHAMDSETEEEEVAIASEDVTEEADAEESVTAEEVVSEEPTPATDQPVEEPAPEVEEAPEAETTPEQTPSRPTRRSSAPRMTATQRRLALPFEEREVVDLRSINSRYTYMRATEIAALGEDAPFESGDYVYVSSPSRTRTAVNRGNVANVVISWSGYRRNETDDNTYASYSNTHFTARGNVQLYREGDEWKARFSEEPRCSCAEYRDNGNGHCPHVDGFKTHIATATHFIADRTGFNAARAVANVQEGETPVIAVAAGSTNRRAGRVVDMTVTDSTGFPHDQFDGVNAPTRTNIRAALNTGHAVVPVTWYGWRRTGSTEHIGSFNVTGDVTLGNQEDGSVGVVNRSLRCNCPQYRENYHCVHVDYVSNQTARMAHQSTSSASVGITHQEVEAAQARDWTRNEELRREMEARRAPSAPEDMYSSNFDAFHADHEAALKRIADGEPAVPFMKENATGGLLAPGTGRRFGVELEFDVTGVPDKYEALRKIGQELYEAGLTSDSRQLGYGSAGRSGYRKWSFESDCTVDAELVSPILSDTPEDWAQLEKACEIIRRNGGTATTRAGSHVHVSSGAFGQNVDKHAEVVRMTQQHEDTIYRLATDPVRGRHRPMRWCAPNTTFNERRIESVREDITSGGYYAQTAISRLSNGHNLGINFQSAGRGDPEKDNIEFRQWDATLDPGVIQAQVKISAAMVAAAERNVDTHGPTTTGTREPVGTRLTRQRALLGRSRRKLTKEELEESTTTARMFIDTLFTRREDKAQITGLFAATKWQRG